jgi:nitrogen regulatory protein PII-like uncharacterized protein
MASTSSPGQPLLALQNQQGLFQSNFWREVYRDPQFEKDDFCALIQNFMGFKDPMAETGMNYRPIGMPNKEVIYVSTNNGVVNPYADSTTSLNGAPTAVITLTQPIGGMFGVRTRFMNMRTMVQFIVIAATDTTLTVRFEKCTYNQGQTAFATGDILPGEMLTKFSPNNVSRSDGLLTGPSKGFDTTKYTDFIPTRNYPFFLTEDQYNQVLQVDSQIDRAVLVHTIIMENVRYDVMRDLCNNMIFPNKVEGDLLEQQGVFPRLVNTQDKSAMFNLDTDFVTTQKNYVAALRSAMNQVAIAPGAAKEYTIVMGPKASVAFAQQDTLQFIAYAGSENTIGGNQVRGTYAKVAYQADKQFNLIQNNFLGDPQTFGDPRTRGWHTFIIPNTGVDIVGTTRKANLVMPVTYLSSGSGEWGARMIINDTALDVMGQRMDNQRVGIPQLAYSGSVVVSTALHMPNANNAFVIYPNPAS